MPLFKNSLKRRKTRWLEFLSQMGVTEPTLQQGRMKVLEDVIFPASHTPINQKFAIQNILSFQFGRSFSTDTLMTRRLDHFQGIERRDAQCHDT